MKRAVERVAVADFQSFTATPHIGCSFPTSEGPGLSPKRVLRTPRPDFLERVLKFNCAYCGVEADRPAGHVNRSRAQGMNLYCSRKCSGLGRRDGKTKAERVEDKRIYDAEYRMKNRALLKAKKAAHHKRTYDPVEAAKVRKERMPYHVAYCRRPKYRAWKREYDRQYRARAFGDFAEAYLILLDIDREVNARMSDYDVRMANGTINKRLKRRREYERLISG